jgi:hypothetical protein
MNVILGRRTPAFSFGFTMVKYDRDTLDGATQIHQESTAPYLSFSPWLEWSASLPKGVDIAGFGRILSSKSPNERALSVGSHDPHQARGTVRFSARLGHRRRMREDSHDHRSAGQSARAEAGSGVWRGALRLVLAGCLAVAVGAAIPLSVGKAVPVTDAARWRQSNQGSLAKARRRRSRNRTHID